MVKTIGNVQKDAQVRAVASGTLSNGDTVIVNSDGTVSAISSTSVSASTSSPATFNTQTSDVNVIYDSVNDKIVMVYRDNGNSNYGTAIVGTLSGSTITFGSETVFNSASVEPCFATYDPNAGKVIAVYRDVGNGGYGTAVVGTVSGTSISFGSEVVFNPGSTQAPRAVYDASSQKIVVVYRDDADGDDGTARVGTVSGTSISFGAEVDFATAAIGTSIDLGYDSDTEQVVIAYRDYSNSNYGTAIVGKVSGTSITFGTKTVFNSTTTYWPAVTYDTTQQKVLISYLGSTGQSIVGTVSGTGISFGTAATFTSVGSPTYISAVYDSAAKVHTIAYQTGTATPYTGRLINATISGTSVSFGTEVEFETGTTSYIGTGFDSTANKVIIGYRDQQNTDAGTYVVRQNAYTSTNLTSDNFIGFADGTYTQPPANIGDEVTYASSPVYSATAYDTANDKFVIAYRDSANSNYGTAIVGTVSGDTVTFGSAAVFESAESNDIGIAYDANAGKFLITYRDNGNSGFGTAVVGTVSGTSITFGTPVVFESASTQYNIPVYDANAQKVVNFYSDRANNGGSPTAVVATISGTSVSFGSPVTAYSGDTYNYAAAYDSGSQKIVFAFRASAAAQGIARVATVSGTSISFGTSTVFTSNVITETTAVYDANADKTVIAYRDNSASNVGKAIVGTVSGTSISFGTEVTFNNAATDETASTYNSDNGTVIIAYKDQGNSDYGTYIIGTVSGTSISFGSEVVFAQEAVRPQAQSVFYDPDQQRTIFPYRKDAGGGFVRSVNAVENPQTGPVPVATVLSTCSVARNQTSLTAGQKYYVQTDGALGLTPADPSVEAGTAISSTEILVKG